MNRSLVFEKLTPVFREVFDDDDLMPTEGMAAKDVPEWDSLNHIRLIVSIETVFAIKFTLAEIAELKNVGGLVSLIQAKI